MLILSLCTDTLLEHEVHKRLDAEKNLREATMKHNEDAVKIAYHILRVQLNL